MKEIFGDLFAYYKKEGYVLCITTNGFVKNNGEGVMGRGCAQEAAEEDPTLPKLLGKSLVARGNNLSLLTDHILSFPVKHNWFEEADINLIRRSTSQLIDFAKARPNTKFILPRPGCGNGRLNWDRTVKPLLESLNLPDNIIVIGFWEEGHKK